MYFYMSKLKTIQNFNNFQNCTTEKQVLIKKTKTLQAACKKLVNLQLAGDGILQQKNPNSHLYVVYKR